MKKFLLPLAKYGSSRLVFRFFGSLEYSRLRLSFCPPAHPEPRKAGRGANSVRAIFRIHRQLEFFKLEEAASLRSAANSYSFLGENEKDLSIRAKEIFSNL